MKIRPLIGRRFRIGRRLYVNKPKQFTKLLYELASTVRFTNLNDHSDRYFTNGECNFKNVSNRGGGGGGGGGCHGSYLHQLPDMCIKLFFTQFGRI